MDVKRKKVRDKNNFINVILNKIQLAKNFSKRCAMTLTQKKILTHIQVKFYLRRRFTKLYLYIRLLDNFGSKFYRGQLIRDLKTLIPDLMIESTTGNYYGYTLEIKAETEQSLIKLLKILSLLAHPEDFYMKIGKRDYSYLNYVDSSEIPIHINIPISTIDTLESIELRTFLNSSIKPRRSNKR